MSLVLWAVSTSSGATIPGKITMSDKPRIGNTSGSELEETRGGASGLPAAPRMLINSVSGEVMVAPFCSLDAAAPRKVQQERLIPLGNRHLGILHMPLRQRHINPQESVQVSRFRLAQIVARAAAPARSRTGRN